MKAAPAPYGMFGSLRFVLGWCAVLGYVVPYRFYLAYEATYVAVMLAGYTAAFQLSRVYWPMNMGWKAYVLDRALRVYPVYFVLLALGGAVVYLEPGFSTVVFFNYAGYPLDGEFARSVYGANLTLFGLSNLDGSLMGPIFVPPVWALNIQLCLWLLAPLLLRYRDLRLVMLGAALYYSVSLVAFYFLLEKPEPWRFVPMVGLYSGVLPFIAGMYIYILREKFDVRLGGFHMKKLALVAVGLLLFQHLVGFNTEVVGFWLMMGVMFPVLWYLSQIDVQALSPKWRTWDALLGGMAWPMALSAVPVATLLVWKFPDLMFMTNEGNVLIANHTTLFQVTLPVTLVVGYVVHRWVELPVTAFRRKLREKYQPSATTPT